MGHCSVVETRRLRSPWGFERNGDFGDNYGTSFLIAGGKAESEPELTVSDGSAQIHAAAIKHPVIRVEKTMGIVKANLQLKVVTARKQMASAHVIPPIRATISAGNLLNCQANTAANTRNTEKKNPNALTKEVPIGPVETERVKVNRPH